MNRKNKKIKVCLNLLIFLDVADISTVSSSLKSLQKIRSNSKLSVYHNLIPLEFLLNISKVNLTEIQ